MTVATDTLNHTDKPMATKAMAGQRTGLAAKPSGPLRLFSQDVKYGDWRDDLVRDGFVVIKEAVPRERAERYGEQMLQWLEDFGLGFDRNDPLTIREENLPVINEKGMVMGYGVAHAPFTWAIRQEPKVVEAFARVYDTDDLIVSFDNINMAFPGRTDVAPNKPWPHQDQDPDRPGFRCLQGLVNILDNGPTDGGLIVCKGAHLLSEEFHDAFRNEPNRIWAWTKEWYGFTNEGMQWLKDKGCEWVKVNAGPGDLILWDSRTPHYNLSPVGNKPRFCTYTCYMPVAEATEGELLKKKAAFDERQSTTHWPNAMHVGGPPVLRQGKRCPYDTPERRTKVAVELTEVGHRLTGIPYIQAH
ncbi:hypothetical protein SEUCBS140593_003018 [Sporothrix eucalyptigena]|uniref:Phytanoyl-CoA dioxygenase n=1 Tax=Sporothrix eucalyptigena TaxID=1812306 RepID=A0ABP0BBB2_9PEZI